MISSQSLAEKLVITGYLGKPVWVRWADPQDMPKTSVEIGVKLFHHKHYGGHKFGGWSYYIGGWTYMLLLFCVASSDSIYCGEVISCLEKIKTDRIVRINDVFLILLIILSTKKVLWFVSKYK